MSEQGPESRFSDQQSSMDVPSLSEHRDPPVIEFSFWQLDSVLF